MGTRKKLPKSIKGQPNAIDVHVGQRIRLRRTLLGFSQEKLGECLALTFQQIQKYERGSNRVGASRLWDLARALDVEVGYFFEEMSEEYSKLSPGQIRGTQAEADGVPFEKDPMCRRETMELARAYYSIKDPDARAQAFKMMKIISKANQSPMKEVA